MASPPLGLCSRHAVDAGDLELLARGPVAFRRIPQSAQKPCVLCAGGDKIGGIVLCALAVWVLRRVAWKDIVHELGLPDSPLSGLRFAILASSHMLVGFLLTRSPMPQMAPRTISFLTVISPLPM